MSWRISQLAVTATLLLVAPVAALQAQGTDTLPRFLTGPCDQTASLVDLDSLVAVPEVQPSLAVFDSVLVPPAELRSRDHDMKVVVAFVVDTNGAVRPGHNAIMSSTDTALSRWACGMVTRLRFQPARDHSRAVATQVMMPFAFQAPVVGSEAAADDHVYLETEVEKKVTLARVVPPKYPDYLKRENLGALVQVQFVVDTAGRAEMSTFRVLRTSDTRFVEAARLSVAATTYQPAELHGRKVRQVVEQPFSFRIFRDLPIRP